MNKEQLKELVKAHFNLVDHTPVKETFGEIFDENKAFKIVFPGDTLKVGDEVKVVTAEGQESLVPDGYHKLIDGTIFDSSYKSSSSSSHGAGGSSKPITFAPDQVIQGWTIAMQLMTEGSVWELIIPPHLGYGDKGAPPSIPGGAVLLFTLEIIKVHDIIGSNAKGLAYLESKKKENDVVTLPSGLLYRVLQAGNNNGRRPSLNTPCELHYTISTIDGKEFDSSYIRGTPMTLAPGQWIRGCKEALQLMTEGAKWELTVPYELGYPAPSTSTIIDEDNDDPISVGSVLIFTLELLKVMNDESHDEL